MSPNGQNKWLPKKWRWRISLFLFLCLVLLNLYYLLTKPTNQGPWLSHYQKLASVEVKENLASIKNFRRARYDDTGSPIEIRWEDKVVNLDQLKSVWYGISVFASPGLAHTFLSFDFGDNDPVVFSVEARMRPDQKYHPITGTLDQYHLIYVIADEKDVIGVRINKRPDEVYFMPINVSTSRIKKMFLDMSQRANELLTAPAFYNTFTSNCTNNIMQATQIPAWQYYFDPRIILPGYSDRIAYEYGVLDSNYPLEAIRDASHLKAGTFDEQDPEFSNRIRTHFYQELTRLRRLENH